MAKTETRETKARKILAEKCHFDKIIVSHKNGTVKVVNTFFYRNGATSETLLNEVRKHVPEAVYVNGGIEYKEWPKDSFVWVEFRIKTA